MRKSTVVKGILLTLVGGCVIVAPGAIIPLGALAKFLVDAHNAPIPVHIPPESDPEKVRQSLYRLRRNEYIKLKKIGKNKFQFELTKKGRKLLEKYNFSDFKIERKGLWDGNWRIFLFDVPEKKRATRDFLRKKLKNLGFFRFQRSVWIYPFECEEEINYICESLEAESYSMMFTGRVHEDSLLRKYFLRKGILAKDDLRDV